MRQDAEDELIKKSVKLDYDKKEILATLPLRGPEEEFLAPNEERARCVLDQQCKKLKGKPDDIKAVQKSFQKLFDRGHAKLLEDIPEDVLADFIEKEVQHCLPRYVW